MKAAHEALTAKGVLRIESTLIIDDRKDKLRTMKNKVDPVKNTLNNFKGNTQTLCLDESNSLGSHISRAGKPVKRI